MIQAVLFENDKWQPKEEVRWLLENEHKASDMVVTTEFTKFIQFKSDESNNDYQTMDVGRGIHFVFSSKRQQPNLNFA